MPAKSATLDELINDTRLMRRLKGLKSTSARIRALHDQGLSKKDIVSFLNARFKEPGRPNEYRYQHVYNVLKQPKSRPGRPAAVSTEPSGTIPERLTVQIDSAGRIVIPAMFRAAMGVAEGDRLIGHVVDGELRLISPRMAVRLAQKMVAESIPGDDSLADSLVADRRRQFQRDYPDGNGGS